MRFAITTAVMVVLLAIGGLASAQPNDCTTVVLHGEAGFPAGCTTGAGVDCETVAPTVQIDSPSGLYGFYMFARNYDDLAGIQVAFQWPATWSLGSGTWTCQTNQLSLQTPADPGGPGPGSIVTSFTGVTGGALAMIGFMIFPDISSGGCLEIVTTTAPGANSTLTSGLEQFPIREENQGKVCVNEPGIDVCECQMPAVEPASWGRIKGTYGR